MMHIADNQDALLDYLYEEGDPAEHLKIAKHLQECASCSVAVLEFQTVRGMLSEWKPPASQLGFRMVQDDRGAGAPGSKDDRGAGAPGSKNESAQPQPERAWWAPSSRFARVGRLGSWATAAAAVLLFAAGMAVSQLNVDYRDGALTVRPRSAAPAGPAIRHASIQLPPSPQTVQVENAPNSATSQTASTEQLLQRVRAMIEQSEIRQQRELALRLTQVAREVDTQHQADLQRIHQNLGQFEMETGAQINQQQQMMDYLVRTSGGLK